MPELPVGSIVTSIRSKVDAGKHCGMVVDHGITSRGELYVIILDELTSLQLVQWRPRGGRQWHNLRTVAVRQLPVDDVDVPLTIPAGSPASLHQWARRAVLSAGVRTGYVGPPDRELLGYADGLLELADQ